MQDRSINRAGDCLRTDQRAATRFVSKDDLEAIISREAIAKAGASIVTLKCEGEALSVISYASLIQATFRLL
jgi:hypothetical protein